MRLHPRHAYRLPHCCLAKWPFLKNWLARRDSNPRSLARQGAAPARRWRWTRAAGPGPRWPDRHGAPPHGRLQRGSARPPHAPRLRSCEVDPDRPPAAGKIERDPATEPLGCAGHHDHGLGRGTHRFAPGAEPTRSADSGLAVMWRWAARCAEGSNRGRQRNTVPGPRPVRRHGV
jgi:hypothetical protein